MITFIFYANMMSYENIYKVGDPVVIIPGHIDLSQNTTMEFMPVTIVKYNDTMDNIILKLFDIPRISFNKERYKISKANAIDNYDRVHNGYIII